MSNWEQIGQIGVDAGIVWFGDPCYILHKDQPYKELGSNWGDFCKTLDKNRHYEKGFTSFNSLGICVETTHGDGTYPVFAKKNRDGRICEVKVMFEGYPGDEDDEFDRDYE